METFEENNYTKEEDFMMWDLHRIRHEMQKEKLTAKAINEQGEAIIRKYGLNKIKEHRIPEHSR